MTRRPVAIVVAGPSGSGKSEAFAVARFGVSSFNVDDRAASLNGGSYATIAPSMRRRAQLECEAFVGTQIAKRESYAVETTLRSLAAIEQARRATDAGFATRMFFVATCDVEENVRRVRLRGLTGGHSAPEEELRDIYRRSLANLEVALDVFERVDLFDATRPLEDPTLVARKMAARFVSVVAPLPAWVPARFR